MSCERGNCAKSGRQKYQNRRAFRNDLHNCSRTTKALNALEITGCCRRCREVIEWKIKFNKYKQLNQPKKCVKCLQKSVKNSYYTTCQKCIESQNICGKCGDALSDESQSQAAITDSNKTAKEISSKSKSSKSSRDAKKAENNGEEEDMDDDDEEDDEDSYDDEEFNNTDEHKGQTKIKGSIALKIAGVADEMISSKHIVKFKDQCEEFKDESGKKSEGEHESDDESKDERNTKETPEIDTEQSSEAEDGDSDDESYNTDDEDEADEDDSKQTRH